MGLGDHPEVVLAPGQREQMGKVRLAEELEVPIRPARRLASPTFGNGAISWPAKVMAADAANEHASIVWQCQVPRMADESPISAPDGASKMLIMGKPDGGMFSIKMTTEGSSSPQYDYCVHYQEHDSGDGGRCSLMSFSPEGKGPSIAANIPVGNRALLYVAGHQKFVWAFEYTGTIEDGKRVALLNGVYDPTRKWRGFYRPIRHLAMVDLDTAPTLAQIKERTDIDFNPNSFTMKYITADEYQRIYDAISWQWTIGDGPWTSAAPLPPPKPSRIDSAATPNGGANGQAKPSDLSPATVKHIYATTYARRMKEDQRVQGWHAGAVTLLKDVKNASAQELANLEFSKRLWKDNWVSSAPDGIDMKRVVESRELAEWIGKIAKTPLPPRGADRIIALEKIYDELRDRVKPLVADNMPRSRVLRVMAALFPEDYCFVVTVNRLRKVGEAMFGKLPREELKSPAPLNARILGRLAEILGSTDGTPEQLAFRNNFVWILWKTVEGQANDGASKPLNTDRSGTPNGGMNIPTEPQEFVLPPIPNAESLLASIRRVHVQGMPERNMEDVVKTFFISLGHSESAISFQVGHVDVRVDDECGKGRIIVEVKRSLLVEKARQDALRKGFDYASRHGAPMVVITDADVYEVYDRNRGIGYDSMLCGRFQLTRYTPADGTVLDLLRSAKSPNIS